MSSRRRVGEERLYYCPPAMRKLNQPQQQEQLKKNCSSSSSSSSSPGSRGLKSDSNLNCFLEHTTPVIPAQHFPRSSMQAWRNRKNVFHPFFNLSDLWESFKEWSVYGAGVPLVLDGIDSVIQYYVPSLSGIQLYVDPSRNFVEQRKPGEESDSNSSTSEGDNESFTDRFPDRTGGSWNQQSTSGQIHTRHAHRSHTLLGSSTDVGYSGNSSGLLIYEYFERDIPFHREPLAYKISLLASRFPALESYRSCDLTQASWISIAWYPIYRIPVGPTLQNMDTCFLTFHSLSKPVESRLDSPGSISGYGEQIHMSASSEGMHGVGSRLSLPTFGLASYKLKLSDWSSNGVPEVQKMNSLLQATGNWLQLLQVNHPDYNFFTSHRYEFEIGAERPSHFQPNTIREYAAIVKVV